MIQQNRHFKFMQNYKNGGFALGLYDSNAEHPTNVNWSRQSVYSGPKKPQLRWEVLIKNIQSNSLLVCDKMKNFYFSSIDGGIYIVGPMGNLNKLFQTKKPILSPIIGENNIIYAATSGSINSEDNKLYAINEEGLIMWFVEIGAISKICPVIDVDGTIYVITRRGKLFAISSTGLIKWVFEVGVDFWSVPVISRSGTVYIGAVNKKLYMIDRDGCEKYSILVGDGMSQYAPVLDSDENLYMYNESEKGKISIISATGQIVNEISLENREISTSPIITEDNKLYVGVDCNSIMLLSKSGQIYWEVKVDGFISQPLMLDNEGTVYVSSYTEVRGKSRSCIMAIKKDGTIKWKYRLNGEIVSFILCSDSSICMLINNFDDSCCKLSCLGD